MPSLEIFGAMEVLFLYFICWNQLGNWKRTGTLKYCLIVNKARPTRNSTDHRYLWAGQGPPGRNILPQCHARAQTAPPPLVSTLSCSTCWSSPYVRALPCSPYPSPYRAGRSKIPFLHRELLNRHLAPRSPLLLVPPLRHQQAAALSGRATTGEVVHACLLHQHEQCRTQDTVHHMLRRKHAIVVRLYGRLSDSWPPLIASDPGIGATRSTPTPHCSMISEPTSSTTSPACYWWCPSALMCHRGGASALSPFLPEPLKLVH
jgi:hypothetical protein